MSEMLTLASNEKSDSAEAATAESSAFNYFALSDRFVCRHIGPSPEETRQMLETCGFKTLEGLIDTTVPAQIRLRQPLNLPASRSEHGLLGELRKIASENRVFRSFIGMGYHD